MKEFVTIGYSYDELNDDAKEKVKQWYLNHEWRNEAFQENTEADLLEQFPNSNLEVMYSLNYCQGDGLNIKGKLNLYDFLDIWYANKEKKQVVKNMLDNVDTYYHFYENSRYCYSCKFTDRQYIQDEIDTKLDEFYEATNEVFTDVEIIQSFYNSMLNYFEKLDKKLEKDGYKYLYECEDWEVADFCEANDYYFTKNGELIG